MIRKCGSNDGDSTVFGKMSWLVSLFPQQCIVLQWLISMTCWLSLYGKRTPEQLVCSWIIILSLIILIFSLNLWFGSQKLLYAKDKWTIFAAFALQFFSIHCNWMENSADTSNKGQNVNFGVNYAFKIIYIVHDFWKTTGNTSTAHISCEPHLMSEKSGL